MTETASKVSADIRLRDGTAAHLRRLAEDDMDRLSAFGTSLTRDDWLYLDVDMRSPSTLARLVTAYAATTWRQLVAQVEDRIVGYSSVRMLPGWKSHVGDIHLVVADEVRGQGLGTLLARATVDAGRELGVHKLLLEMVAEQSAGRTIFERLGFRVEGRLVSQARDDRGELHDLLVLGHHLEPAPATPPRDS